MPEPAGPLPHVFEALLSAFGPQGWWPARTDEEVVVGAVLTQAVSWRNVEIAVETLRALGLLSLRRLAAADPASVAPLIRPTGYFNVKARKLRSVARAIVSRGGLAAMRRRDPLELRRELLAVWGVGPETADAILCYALGFPCFVADAYAQRIAVRAGWVPPGSGYEATRRFFEEGLAGGDLGELHALLVRLAKDHCHRRLPACAGCPLRGDCATGRTGRLPSDGIVAKGKGRSGQRRAKEKRADP
jgi:endonuclease-3 related protein